MNETVPGASRIDRPHRFAVGDMVAHADDVNSLAEVVEQTWRVRHHVAYPTYTLYDPLFNEEIDDVLCTRDLVSPKEEK